MTFDRSAYEREQHGRQREIAQKLLDIVPWDEWENGPAVEFTCPRGHSLKRYRAERTRKGVVLSALPGVAGKSGPVTSSGWGAGQAKSPCEVPGCPTLVDHDGRCAEHGGTVNEVLDVVRPSFACRRCDWSDSFTAARLMQVYGMAVHLGAKSMPVTGAMPTTRR